ncbi:MAG: DegT/DnrJ/EryC1/StrS family aminotransferase [Planctomycetota bacterium]
MPGPLPDWPPADADVRQALDRAFASGDWGRYHGENCQALRDRLAEMHGVRHTQLTCSGTLAVELALRAVGVAAGDEVVLAGYDFPGNFRAIEAVGARPVLVDVVAGGWVLDVECLRQASADGRLDAVRAVVVSHLHGQCVAMPALMELAGQHGWAVVEDACQSPGAVIQGRPAGSWGDAGVLSFGGSKLLTAGRGGALLTDDPAIAQRAKVYAGRGNDAYPLSELQAAVLLPQLAKLPAHNRTRNAAVARLLEATRGLPAFGRTSELLPGCEPALYKVPWLLGETFPVDRRAALVAALNAEGVPFGEGFRGFVSRSTRRCRSATGTTHARRAADQTILLHHPCLLGSATTLDAIAAALHKVAAAFAATGDEADQHA